MTKFYSVGPDSLDEYERKQVPESYEWVVYSYESGCYEGSGTAIGFNADAKLILVSLGHCSCYGPMEDFGGHEIDPSILDSDEVGYDEIPDAVALKVKELLSNACL